MYLSVFPRAAPHSRGAGFLGLYHAQRSGAREHLRLRQDGADFASIIGAFGERRGKLWAMAAVLSCSGVVWHALPE